MGLGSLRYGEIVAGHVLHPAQIADHAVVMLAEQRELASCGAKPPPPVGNVFAGYSVAKLRRRVPGPRTQRLDLAGKGPTL